MQAWPRLFLTLQNIRGFSMIGLIQVVKSANVKINDVIVGDIERGILALVGIEKTDTEDNAKKLAEKMLNYRIFRDENNKTNLSLKDAQGGLLLVPQFTLVADTIPVALEGANYVTSHQIIILF